MHKVSEFESNAITLTSIFGKKKIFLGSIWPEHNQRVNEGGGQTVVGQERIVVKWSVIHSHSPCECSIVIKPNKRADMLSRDAHYNERREGGRLSLSHTHTDLSWVAHRVCNSVVLPPGRLVGWSQTERSILVVKRWPSDRFSSSFPLPVIIPALCLLFTPLVCFKLSVKIALVRAISGLFICQYIVG